MNCIFKIQHYKSFSVYVLLLCMTLFLPNCGITRPTVDNMQFASVGFQHTGNEASCSTCHNGDRPSNSLGFLNLNTAAPFDYRNHGGTFDCQACHTVATVRRDRTDWAHGFFSHGPVNPTSCGECHSTERPMTYGSANTPHPPTGDCQSCHAQSLVAKTYSTMAGWQGGQGFSHTGSETSCNSCHNVDRPKNTLGFTNLNANAPFDYPTHGSSVDCLSCHKVTSVQRSRADWATGHYAHSPTPSSCQNCHSSQRPATYGNNVSHPTSGECLGCHQASLSTSYAKINDWAGGVGMSHASAGSTNTTAAKALDCISCHGKTGTANQKLSVLPSAHYQQATTCVGCHSDFSSFGALKFNHSSNAGTCQNCHNFNSGNYTSFTNISKFNTSNSFTLGSSVNVSGSKSDDGRVLSFTRPHSDSHLSNCSACHSYTAPVVGANVWQWRHDPNGGSKSSNGCNLCH